jgi:hypothetical protein
VIPSTSGLVGLTGYTTGAGTAPSADLPPHRGVGATPGVGRADHGHTLRMEERVEIQVAQCGGAAGDVERYLGHGRDLT